MNSTGGAAAPPRTKVKPWGPQLMPLGLAVKVFKRSERTFWYMRKQGHVQIQTLVGAAYVVLPTLRASLGDATYELCMSMAPPYDEKTGWKA